MNESTNKKGAALIYVVLLSAMIIILGMGLMNVTSSSYELSVEETKHEQAYLSSKSGLNFFLNSLKGESNEDLQKLLDSVKSTYLQKTVNINDKVGDITIKLTNVTDYKIQIDSTSDVNGVSATTTAYLERTVSLLGFDFEDKPFYYYDSYSGGDKNGEFGTYKYATKYKKPGTGAIQSKFGTISLEKDEQFSKIDENQEVVLTDSIKKAIDQLRLEDTSIPEPGVSGCILKDRSMDYSDDPYANDVKYINCTLDQDTIDQTLYNIYGREDYEVDFDLLFFEDNNYSLSHQVLIFVDDLSLILPADKKLTIKGFNFYNQDVVYLSLSNPNDINRIVIIDEDSKLSYAFKDDFTKLKLNGNSKSQSFKYIKNEMFTVFNLNGVDSDENLIDEPQGPNFFNSEDLGSNGAQLVYDVDGQKSNNFVILIDNVDETYKEDVKDLTLNYYPGQQLDAWIYAPEYTINIKENFKLNGGVIANVINVNQNSDITGIAPNQGFLDLIKSDYVDLSWRVVYE
jgi:hypothetical protein